MILNIKKVRSKFIEAKEKALETNAPILFSITDDTKIDLLSLINLKKNQFRKKIYWSQPSTKFEFIALGEAMDLSSKENKKSDVNNRIIKMIINKIDCNSTQQKNIPVFIGGQNFDINKSNKNIWENFPVFNYQIPSILILSNHNISTITYNFIIDKDSKLSIISNQIEEYIDIIKNYLPWSSQKKMINLKSKKIFLNKKIFYEKFSLIKRYIDKSEIEKAIISNIMSYSYKGFFPIDKLLLKLKRSYPECTIFLYDYDDKGKYLGASPEKILNINNNNLKIDALAGSTNRTNNKSDDISNSKFILNDKKINEEHDFVVKGIIESLNKIGIKANPSKKNVMILKNILHLKTLITAKIKNKDAIMNILDLLSPTPALSGYPKDKSMNIINDIEDYDRGWYSGSIGWINNNLDCDFFAGLRSMFIDKNKLYIYGGAGIIKDSDKDEEWKEILYKINTIEELVNE